MVYDFFFNDTATTEIYTLSLHDALPIYKGVGGVVLMSYSYNITINSLILLSSMLLNGVISGENVRGEGVHR